jgi:hypothetical protein
MSIYRGAAEVKALYRGTIPIREVRRGTALVWSRSAIHDGFDWDGFLRDWINELCSGGDPGQLISDGLGGIIDGLDNEIGQVVAHVEGGINSLGKLVATGSDTLIDAYCSAWGGSAPPDGLVGLINGIPLIGSTLGDWLSDFLKGNVDITSLIGTIPVVGELGKMIGLLPDQLGQLLDPLNYIVDTLGNVVGTLTCGQFQGISSSILENVCYVIGVVGQSARMLIPDGLMSLNKQISRYRHPTLLGSDDGWLEVQLSSIGSPGFATQAFRRYVNNGTGASGVGIDVRDSAASIVRRVGSVDTLVAPALGGVGPGSVLRLDQAGNVHTLLRDGEPLGSWTDGTGTAPLGAAYRSVAMAMQAAKEFGGTRLFSPSFNYLDAA